MVAFFFSHRYKVLLHEQLLGNIVGEPRCCFSWHLHKMYHPSDTWNEFERKQKISKNTIFARTFGADNSWIPTTSNAVSSKTKYKHFSSKLAFMVQFKTRWIFENIWFSVETSDFHGFSKFEFWIELEERVFELHRRLRYVRLVLRILPAWNNARSCGHPKLSAHFTLFESMCLPIECTCKV